MPSRSHRVVVAAFALICSCANVAAAQGVPTHLSLDAAVGGGHGWRGGERVERGLIAGDLLIAIRLAGAGREGFLMGFEASRDWQMNGDLVCLLRPDGTCTRQYPGFDGLTVVAGHQWQWSQRSFVRVLGGPGYFTAHFDHNSTTNHSVGFGARSDIAVRLFRPVSATLATRGAWVPHMRGQSYIPAAVMFGLRLEH